MGWESRDWAKWSDEERGSYLGLPGPASAAGHRRPTQRTRVVVWGSLAAVIVGLTVVAWGAHSAFDAISPSTQYSQRIDHVVYGWRHVPPHGYADMDPSQVGDSIGGEPVICTERAAVGGGRYVCDAYTVVYPGWRVVVLPDDYSGNAAPCQQPHPGGRIVPCPQIPIAPAAHPPSGTV